MEILQKKKSKVYFSEDTEKAIIKYNLSNDPDVREKLFREEIYGPLDKLAENVINRFKFPYMEGTFDEIKSQVVSFLVINLHKFTEDKGKAFYTTTIPTRKKRESYISQTRPKIRSRWRKC
jgi:hypothetical protein